MFFFFTFSAVDARIFGCGIRFHSFSQTTLTYRRIVATPITILSSEIKIRQISGFSIRRIGKLMSKYRIKCFVYYLLVYFLPPPSPSGQGIRRQIFLFSEQSFFFCVSALGVFTLPPPFPRSPPNSFSDYRWIAIKYFIHFVVKFIYLNYSVCVLRHFTAIRRTQNEGFPLPPIRALDLLHPPSSVYLMIRTYYFVVNLSTVPAYSYIINVNARDGAIKSREKVRKLHIASASHRLFVHIQPMPAVPKILRLRYTNKKTNRFCFAERQLHLTARSRLINVIISTLLI